VWYQRALDLISIPLFFWRDCDLDFLVTWPEVAIDPDAGGDPHPQLVMHSFIALQPADSFIFAQLSQVSNSSQCRHIPDATLGTCFLTILFLNAANCA